MERGKGGEGLLAEILAENRASPGWEKDRDIQVQGAHGAPDKQA